MESIETHENVEECSMVSLLILWITKIIRTAHSSSFRYASSSPNRSILLFWYYPKKNINNLFFYRFSCSSFSLCHSISASTCSSSQLWSTLRMFSHSVRECLSLFPQNHRNITIQIHNPCSWSNQKKIRVNDHLWILNSSGAHGTCSHCQKYNLIENVNCVVVVVNYPINITLNNAYYSQRNTRKIILLTISVC